MEGGFDLDSPDDDWMIRIGEPDAASIDEIPKPMVTLEQVEASPQYWYLVESETAKNWKKRYDGHVIADAMAAYTAAILDGEEYVMLESLRMPENGPG
jgi:hypothetical protein